MQCSSSFGVDVFPNLPWMATTIPALAALLQVPVSFLVKAFGEPAVATMMILGQLSFVAMGAICVFVSRDEIASWGYGIISLYVLQVRRSPRCVGEALLICQQRIGYVHCRCLWRLHFAFG